MMHLRDLIVPAGICVGAFIVGLVCEKIMRLKLRHSAARTQEKLHNILITSLSGMAVLFFALLGIDAALPYLPLPLNMFAMLTRLLTILIVLLATVVSARILTGLVAHYTPKAEGAFQGASMFANLTRGLVFLVGGLVAMQYLGVSIAPLLTALGVGGLAVALALQDTLSNLFAGLQIIASRQVSIGDNVRLSGGEEGTVADISWRNTVIHTLTGGMVIVPNAKLASTVVTIFQRPPIALDLVIPVLIGFTNDFERVEKIAQATACAIVRDFPAWVTADPPIVRLAAINEMGLQCYVIFKVREYAQQYPLRHEFLKRLHGQLMRAGIAPAAVCGPLKKGDAASPQV